MKVTFDTDDILKHIKRNVPVMTMVLGAIFLYSLNWIWMATYAADVPGSGPRIGIMATICLMSGLFALMTYIDRDRW